MANSFEKYLISRWTWLWTFDLVLQQCKVALVSKAKLLENHREIHNYINDPTLQNDKRIYSLQNSSNLDITNQIVLRLHKPNSTIFYSYVDFVTFRLTVAQ